MFMSDRSRILVVEDEPLIAELLRDWLSDLGCEVVGPAASNGAGLALLAEGPLSGAILDISVLDGQTYDIAEALQQQGVPFLFATGHNSEGIDPQFRGVPVLQKPFVFDALAAAVSELGGMGNQAAQLTPS